MNDPLQQLKYILQMLALPVIGQVRLIDGDCARVAVLSAAFNASHHALRADTGERLTPRQLSALTRIDNRLLQLRQPTSPPLCSELSLRKSSEWREVRMTAREALVRFGWRLEVPPRDGREGIWSGPIATREPTVISGLLTRFYASKSVLDSRFPEKLAVEFL